jgi:hypothetical protein
MGILACLIWHKESKLWLLPLVSKPHVNPLHGKMCPRQQRIWGLIVVVREELNSAKRPTKEMTATFGINKLLKLLSAFIENDQTFIW